MIRIRERLELDGGQEGSSMGWQGTSMAKGGVRAMNAGQKARERQRREREEGSTATLPRGDEPVEHQPSAGETTEDDKPTGR